MKLAEVLWGPEVWCQGVGSDRKGRHCLIGANSEIDGGFAGLDRLLKIVGVGVGVSSWNDDPARTWDEVAAVVEEYDRLTLLEEMNDPHAQPAA